jgi:hypothetical protein
MRLRDLRPCWGVAFSVGKASPRVANCIGEDGVTVIGIRSHYTRAQVGSRLWRFIGAPFTEGHEGRNIGRVLWATIRRDDVLVYGLVEAAFLRGSVLSVGVLSDKLHSLGDVWFLQLVAVQHVAVITNSLGAFDTFLKPLKREDA